MTVIYMNPHPTNFKLLRQNIGFSYSERIPVTFSWLFHSFSFFFFCYFTFLLIFTKIMLLLLYFFFSWKLFLFFHVPGCSGMFRNVPACSGMFRVPGFIDGRIYKVNEQVWLQQLSPTMWSFSWEGVGGYEAQHSLYGEALTATL